MKPLSLQDAKPEPADNQPEMAVEKTDQSADQTDDQKAVEVKKEDDKGKVSQ